MNKEEFLQEFVLSDCRKEARKELDKFVTVDDLIEVLNKFEPETPLSVIMSELYVKKIINR